MIHLVADSSSLGLPDRSLEDPSHRYVEGKVQGLEHVPFELEVGDPDGFILAE